jgi:hypothetical protein
MINLICDRALLAGHMERTGVITPRLVRKAALGLRGMEDEGIRMPAGLLRRLIPFLVPVILLVSAIIYAITKGK